jgi:hypothetical protein
VVYTVMGAEAGAEQRETWLAALVAGGAARECITSLGEPTNGRNRTPESVPTRARSRSAVRAPEPALAH